MAIFKMENEEWGTGNRGMGMEIEMESGERGIFKMANFLKAGVFKSGNL